MAVPQINDVDLPSPSASNAPEYKEGYRGNGRIMADGSVVFDWVTAARKREWTLRWQNIVSSDLEIIRTAYNTVAGASATGIKFEETSGGTAYYVTLNPSNQELEVQTVKAANGVLRYNVALYLREV